MTPSLWYSKTTELCALISALPGESILDNLVVLSPFSSTCNLLVNQTQSPAVADVEDVSDSFAILSITYFSVVLLINSHIFINWLRVHKCNEILPKNLHNKHCLIRLTNIGNKISPQKFTQKNRKLGMRMQYTTYESIMLMVVPLKHYSGWFKECNGIRV